MFAPILPATGLVGFKLLEQTQTVQREIFDRQPEIARDTDYFRETIATVQSAGALVEDRRLLRVALGAFGLDEEIDKRAFIRKILEEGTEA
ncbi:MAG: flagellar protein, partial [Pseudomonadota bacterium]